MSRLSGRVAIVTGAGRGIGAATAFKFAKEGAKVALFDLKIDEKNEAVKEVNNLDGKALPISVDVSEVQQVKQAVEHVVKHFGKVDILVNNAGVLNDNSIEDMQDDQWNQVIDVNLKGAFICSRAVQQHMKKQQYGKIVNLSSLAALGTKGRANYASAKAGVQGLTRALSMELGPQGIYVNAIAPGFIETEMSKASSEAAKKRGIGDYEENKQKFIQNNPIQRVGTVDDVANSILFFSSNESNYITGQILYVSGRP